MWPRETKFLGFPDTLVSPVVSSNSLLWISLVVMI